MGSYTYPADPSNGQSYSMFIFHDNTYDAFLMPSLVPYARGHEDSFYPWRINAKGHGWGYAPDSYPPDPNLYFWDGTSKSTPFGETDTPIDLNDQDEIVVSEAAPGEGYLLKNNTPTPFASLLAIPVRTQVNNIQPFSVSNQKDPSTDSSIHILASASDNGTNETLLFKRDNTGAWTVATVQVPTGVTVTDWNTINRNGIVAAIGKPSATATTNHALLLIPVESMVDANRDGKMSFTDPDIHDKDSTTTKDKPFTFWLNNNHDEGTTVDGNDWEEDSLQVGSQYGPDCNVDTIKWRRDLEDFTRLWVNFKNLTSVINQSGVTATFEMKPTEGDTWAQADGNPSLRIFPAYETQDGGNKYLFDDATAWQQVDQEGLGIPVWGKAYGVAGQGQSCPLPTTDSYPTWTMPSESDPYRYFIFEGVTAGKGRLVLTIYKDGQKIGEYPPVYLELKDVKDMYERWSAGDVSASGVNYNIWPAANATQQLGPSGKPLPDPKTNDEKDYLVLVHGWNMEPWVKDAYAETAFKRLWHRGYKGRFGVFKWPTFHVSLADRISTRQLGIRGLLCSAWLQVSRTTWIQKHFNGTRRS